MPTWRKTGNIWLSVFKQSFILRSPKVVKGFTLNWPLKRSSYTCAPKPTAHTSHCFANSNIKIMTFFKSFPWICHFLLLSTSVTHNSPPKAPKDLDRNQIQGVKGSLKMFIQSQTTKFPWWVHDMGKSKIRYSVCLPTHQVCNSFKMKANGL